MKKRLSAVKLLSLVLTVDVISFVISMILAAVLGEEAVSIVKQNIALQLISMLYSIYISINFAYINQEFKKMSFWKIASVLLSFVLRIIDSRISYSLLGIPNSKITTIILTLISLPVIFYQYRGYYNLTVGLPQNKLSENWKFLGQVNMGIALITIFGNVAMSVEKFSSFISDNALPLLALSAIFTVITLIATVLGIVYTVKTIKELKKVEIA